MATDVNGRSGSATTTTTTPAQVGALAIIASGRVTVLGDAYGGEVHPPRDTPDDHDATPARPAVRPYARVWWSWDLDPRTAAPWISDNGAVNIPVGALVAPLVGLDATVTGAGRTKRRCKVENIPAILSRHVEIAISQWITSPDAHPQRDTAIVR